MQHSDWAELLTKTKPSRTVAGYKPSSPRARLGSLSAGSARATSSMSNNSDAAHNDQRRGGGSLLHGQTRIEHLTRSVMA